ncbi:MAG: polyprenyl synthetase family protein [archaeon]|nr:MAG: polyprenyl synthetase family protein [archaeon]
MPKQIFDYMKETSRESDEYTLKCLESLKQEGKDIFDYTNHLPHLRNRVGRDLAIPKARNTLARLIYESLSTKNWKKIIPILSFIELSTIATYVLDDIIDNQEQRQGDESTWKKFGSNEGIIAAGLQQVVSFKQLESLDLPNSEKLKVFGLATDMWKKLWIGEGFNEEMKEGTSEEEYIKRCCDLNGIMFDTIAQISAICAGGNNKQIRIASKIGNNYGMAVMVRNDLADLLEKLRKHSKALSKKPFEDIRKGIWTYPVIHFMRSDAQEQDKESFKKILGKQCAPRYGNFLYTLLENAGSIHATLDLVTKFKEKTNQEIEKLPAGKSRDLLFELTDLLENLRMYT